MSRPTPPNDKTRNWRSCTDALRERGLLTIWFDPGMSWDAAPTGDLLDQIPEDEEIGSVTADGAYDRGSSTFSRFAQQSPAPAIRQAEAPSGVAAAPTGRLAECRHAA